MASPPVQDYSKLTVPQLKALCKEKRLSGYSKLSKSALVQKLLEADGSPPAGSNSKEPDPSVACSKDEQPSAPPPKPPADGLVAPPSQTRLLASSTGVAKPSTKAAVPVGRLLEHSQQETLSDNLASSNQVLPFPSGDTSALLSAANCSLLHSPASSPSNSRSLRPGDAEPALLATICAKNNDSKTQKSLERTETGFKPTRQPTTQSRKRASEVSRLGPPAKKIKAIDKTLSRLVVESSSVTQLQRTLAPSSNFVAPSVASSLLSSSNPAHPLAGTNTTQQLVKVLTRPPKRFKPLLSTRKLQQGPSPAPPAPPGISIADSPASAGPQPHLDFPGIASPPQLYPITLPPSLSQRKRVRGWAVILSGLSNESRKNCALVSRMFRYAVYLSAGHILEQQFRGKRLTDDLASYSLAMTNLWPYLRFREEEAVARQRIYAGSFLGRLAAERRVNPIATRLWGCPDGEKQAEIAVRFVMTSFWFALSIGGRKSEEWLRGTVIDAQEVIPEEIWRVTVRIRDAVNGIQTSSFYVLERTCEVIGYGASPRGSSGPTGELSNLRVDWSAHIQRYVAFSSRLTPLDNGTSILGQVKWAHYEEYDRGISRLWRKRIGQEGDTGKSKLLVAERYILACVVANSVSGAWMSTTEMAQESVGLPQRHLFGASSVKANNRALSVNLFLPSHHHVESVHFTTPSGEFLHPALAVVQTSTREYYILKDNGMEVGSEEDGVAPLWMEVLEYCDNRGLARKD